MTDPLDTAAIRKRAQHAADWRHLWANEDLQRGDNLAISAMRAAKQLAVDDVPALIALIAELEAEQQNGEWQYGLVAERTGEFVPQYSREIAEAFAEQFRRPVARRWVGPATPISDTTGDQQ